MKYTCNYDDQEIFVVKVDEQKALPFIKEMVEFWSNWEWKLKDNKGNYIETWLQNLVLFAVTKDRPPNDSDEGWYPSNFEKYGFKIESFNSYIFNTDQISIETE